MPDSIPISRRRNQRWGEIAAVLAASATFSGGGRPSPQHTSVVVLSMLPEGENGRSRGPKLKARAASQASVVCLCGHSFRLWRTVKRYVTNFPLQFPPASVVRERRRHLLLLGLLLRDDDGHKLKSPSGEIYDRSC